MTTQEVANRLVELCRQGKNMDAINELYSSDIVSVEPEGAPMGTLTGIDAVRGKTEGFFQGVKEFHDSYTSDPVVGGDHFSCAMGMDITMQDGMRMQMNEVAVYEVKDGKVVREEFFFKAHPPA